MADAIVIDHPLVQHKLTHHARSQGHLDRQGFRRLLREICGCSCATRSTRDLKLTEVTIETPLAETQAPVLAGKKLVFASILRAGNGLLEGMLDLVPSARVAHIGLVPRSTRRCTPVEYYFKAPQDMEDRAW